MNIDNINTTLSSSAMTTDDLAKVLAGDLFSSFSTDSLDPTSLITLESNRPSKHTIDQPSPLNSTDAFHLVNSMGFAPGDTITASSSNSSLFSSLSNPALPNYGGLVSSSRSSESSMFNMLLPSESSRQHDLYLCQTNGTGGDSHSMDEALFRTTLHGGFPIKPRHRTTKRQYSILERQFRRNPRPDAATRDALAAKLSMRGRTVQIWFQNRRAKCKRDRERGRPTPPLPRLNDESDLCDDGMDDLNPGIDWDPTELDSEGGVEEALLRDSSESSSSKLASGPVSSTNLNGVMMMPDLSKAGSINDWLADINLTGSESQQLVQQLAASNASTAAYLNQLALSVSGATNNNNGCLNDTMTNFDQFAWWSGATDTGQANNGVSTPLGNLSTSLVSSMLANAVLLNQAESNNNNNSKNEEKQDDCTIEQDITTAGLASANWLFGSNIDCLTTTTPATISANTTIANSSIPNPFSLIATTPTTNQVDILKNKDTNTIATEDDDKLNEFRRQLQQQREQFPLELSALPI